MTSFPQQIIYLLKTLVDAFTRYMATLHVVLTRKDDTVLGLPEQVFYTVAGSIVSAGVILGISTYINNRRDKNKLSKERSDYEAFLYEYIGGLVEQADSQASNLAETKTMLDKIELTNVETKQTSIVTLDSFFQLPQDQIYKSLFVNKAGDTAIKAQAYSTILKEISVFHGIVKGLLFSHKEFTSSYGNYQSALFKKQKEFLTFLDNMHISKKAVPTHLVLFYSEIDPVIAKHTSEAYEKMGEEKSIPVHLFIGLFKELTVICKKYDTVDEAFKLLRLCQDIITQYNNQRNLRNSQSEAYASYTSRLRGVSQNLKENVEILKQMPKANK